MSGDFERQARNLIREAYRPATRFEDLLVAIIKDLFAAVAVDRLAIRVEGFDGFAVRRGRGSLRVDILRPTAAEPPADGEGDEGRVVPIVYGERPIGELSWQPRQGDEGREAGALLRQVAAEIAYLGQRYRVARWARAELGQRLLLVGASEEMRRLERQIERAVSIDLPAVVHGEFGSEKLHVACALHYGGGHRDEPFVELKCETLTHRTAEARLAEAFRRAHRGSLFFNGIDTLDGETQMLIPEFLGSQIGQWAGAGGRSAERPARVIASSSRDLRREVEEGRFSRSLFAELGFLSLAVPSIKQREGDLPLLVDYTFSKYRRRSSQRLSAASKSLFASYGWPENVFELERAMARLAAMCDATEISPETVGRSLPKLHREGVSVSPAIVAPAGNGRGRPSAEELVRRVAARDYSFCRKLHPSLRRAIRFIGDNAEEEISLSRLAKEAFISNSHLSFLFRTGLGVTFKPFLGMVRVERAKKLLVDQPQLRITDVSLDVGFGDLSHFEKTFKRLVKVNPREYRRTKLEDLEDAAVEAAGEDPRALDRATGGHG